jgi:hypothetical protein
MATAMATAHLAMDARGWDEAAYRREILRVRDLSCRTLFRAVFFDHGDDADPDVLLVAASSDGSLVPFSLSSCISSASATPAQVSPLLHRPRILETAGRHLTCCRSLHCRTMWHWSIPYALSRHIAAPPTTSGSTPTRSSRCSSGDLLLLLLLTVPMFLFLFGMVTS